MNESDIQLLLNTHEVIVAGIFFLTKIVQVSLGHLQSLALKAKNINCFIFPLIKIKQHREGKKWRCEKVEMWEKK